MSLSLSQMLLSLSLLLKRLYLFLSVSIYMYISLSYKPLSRWCRFGLDGQGHTDSVVVQRVVKPSCVLKHMGIVGHSETLGAVRVLIFH